MPNLKSVALTILE